MIIEKIDFKMVIHYLFPNKFIKSNIDISQIRIEFFGGIGCWMVPIHCFESEFKTMTYQKLLNQSGNRRNGKKVGFVH